MGNNMNCCKPCAGGKDLGNTNLEQNNNNAIQENDQNLINNDNYNQIKNKVKGSNKDSEMNKFIEKYKCKIQIFFLYFIKFSQFFIK